MKIYKNILIFSVLTHAQNISKCNKTRNIGCILTEFGEKTTIEVMRSCGSVVEHCVSSAKVVGSIPRNILTKKYMYKLWIKASAKMHKCYAINATKVALL